MSKVPMRPLQDGLPRLYRRPVVKGVCIEDLYVILRNDPWDQIVILLFKQMIVARSAHHRSDDLQI